MKKILLFIAVSFLCIMQTIAATITVRTSGGDYSTIAEAITAATDGDTIDVLGVFTESGLQVSKSLTLLGHGMENTIIQGNVTKPISSNYTSLTRNGVLHIGNTVGGASINIQVLVKNMTIRHGVTASSGGRAGGISVSRVTGQVTLSGLKISDNWGESSSSQVTGGIFGVGSNLTIEKCWISGNTAYTASSPMGGGMQFTTDNDTGNPGNANNGVVIIRNSTISENVCSTGNSSNGGGIALTSSGTAAGKNLHLSIENSTIYRNISKQNGNGIYVKNVALTAPGTGFGSGNGALKLTVVHCTIAENSSVASSTQGMGINFDTSGTPPKVLFEMHNSIVLGNYYNSGGETALSTTRNQITSSTTIENGGISNSFTKTTSFTGVENQLTGTTPFDYSGLAMESSLSTDSIPVLKIGAGSSAKDYIINNSLNPVLSSDQSGRARLGNPDVGAYEYGLTQTINFDPIGEKNLSLGNIELNATSSSGLNVVYTSSNTDIATINGNTVNFISAGTVSIYANQTGNSIYYPATEVARQLFIVSDPTTEVEYQSLSEIDLESNIVDQYLKIKGRGWSSARIFDMQGKLVRESIEESVCDLKSINSGIYMIVFEVNGQQQKVLKFIKK